MPLITKTGDQYVSDMLAEWAAEVGVQPDFESGDLTLAFYQGVATALMFLQAQAQKAVQLANASTSTGSDLDTWMGQFRFTRKAAVAAEGQLTLGVLQARPTSVQVAPGAIVQTTDGKTQYQIIADTSLSAWNASLNAYVLAAGQTSMTVEAQALTAGSASNVQTNQLVQFQSSVPSIDTVTNASPILNGQDAQSDADFLAAFQLYINSLSKAVLPAIQSTVEETPGVEDANYLENQYPNGTTQLGFFTVVVDDGSGSPPASLLTTVYNALQNIRGFTIQYEVVAPTVVNVSIAFNVKVNSSANQTSVLLNVQNAVLDYVNGLKIGSTLYASKLFEIAFDADPGVVAVDFTSMKLNGSEQDIVATGAQVIRTTSSTVTISTY